MLRNIYDVEIGSVVRMRRLAVSLAHIAISAMVLSPLCNTGLLAQATKQAHIITKWA